MIQHLDDLAESLVESHDKLMSDLISLRKKHHLTQEMVAERMGVSQPTVASFERYDANPTLSSVRRYALAVGATIDHVVEDRCCQFAEQFDAIVRGSSAQWKAVPTMSWEWQSGAMVMKAQYA
ncbi:helix-turn-helix transcriptional regulator [Microbacterium sp. NPDC089320]|uniref:helix-turn-helix domain-containing protein n=1 Tax=Microbacterium sp. NPDC089320 TaxID=3155182 RepID=UPI003446FBBA